jgi:hypothetical protein
MRCIPRLGAVNLALLAIYFMPLWGREALRALMSPYGGFEDRAHAAAVVYFRELFDFGLDGLMRTSNVLAGLKLVIAAGFVAYLIEFARALAVGRELNRETADTVLALAVAAVLILALPALRLDDAGLVRVAATQLMLVAGAVVVVTIERHIEQSDKVPSSAAKPLPIRSLPTAAALPEPEPRILAASAPLMAASFVEHQAHTQTLSRPHF